MIYYHESADKADSYYQFQYEIATKQQPTASWNLRDDQREMDRDECEAPNPCSSAPRHVFGPRKSWNARDQTGPEEK